MGSRSQRGYRCRSFSVMSLLSDAGAVDVRPDPPDREPIASDAVESSDLSTFHGKRRSPKNVPNFAFCLHQAEVHLFRAPPFVSPSVSPVPRILRANKPSADELNLIVTL